ncbi:HEAT repeat domain-containing protein [Chitinophaga arvensicola]|uniref:HEAT repeat-containing protein n=1 Tax=Chitinophaga arvensicola TaxID=29529 RepID=A0A1I0S5I4_9BACT|nr:HEAT repeat domain-containing protein [Chitinophaga arvensicola]SEW50347.1 HEAT repeat-containing protein [Chitinophaga arvensicola]
MRIVRNVKLFFREGNSDKTYEIDLCEVGPEQYIVNFRYGKRFGTLKDGTKTVSPVALPAATTIFDALEKEKRSKGYLGEQEAVQDLSFVPVDTTLVENVRHRAILRRLQDAVEGKSSFKTAWGTSRVIWRAGEEKLTEAVPYLIKLVEKGDGLQRYAALWAMGKIADPAAIPVLRSYADNSSRPLNIRMLAANGLLLVLPAEEKTAHVRSYLERLPEVFQQAVAKGNTEELLALLQQRVVVQQEQSYPLLEDLYIVAFEQAPVRIAIGNLLMQLPFRPSWFQHIRHILKQAELRSDQGIVAILAARFEREDPMFKNPGAFIDYEDRIVVPSTYIKELDQSLQADKELKRPTSKLAYSDRTRNYLHYRILRNLGKLGALEDMNYVRLATALLLQYEEGRDAAKEYQLREYGYVNGRYTTFYRQFPANSRAVYLNYILRGNAANLQLTPNRKEWVIKDPEQPNGQGSTKATLDANPDAAKNNDKGGLMKKLFGWLGGDKGNITPAVPPEYQANTPAPAKPVSDVPFLQLWQQLPQAFIQLLISGKMEAVHAFAMEQLKAHPEYDALKAKMDEGVIAGLLSNTFSIPSMFGLELARERYNPAKPELGLFYVLVMSPLDLARLQGLQWIHDNEAFCFADMDFLMQLIFSPYKEVRDFARKKLTPAYLSTEKARVLCTKAISALLALKAATPEGNQNLNDACQILEQNCHIVLTETGIPDIEALLQSPVAACHAFAARLLLLKQHQFNFSEISDVLLQNLISNAFQPVRAAGVQVLEAMGTTELLKRPELVLHILLSTYTDVRNAIRPLIGRLVQQDKRLAVYLVNEMVPLLMRKETAEGMHADIEATLSNELVEYLQDIDTATALRLLYANYRSAQQFGLLVLDKYIPAAALSLKQVIAAGNHELLKVREWSWHFFYNNLARIRFERDAAIGLLDAKWDDTRQQAMEFFRTQFTDNDWSPETLVAVADSVRTDIQAFGRELLMRFFRQEDGQTYLLKLSQHPSEGMQLFATNYLQQYAAGNLVFLQDLEPYFRVVLSRVNKARAAKERIFTFLEKEALKSPEAATYIGHIVAHISATVSIGDKARCISIMRSIQAQYDVELPIEFVPTVIRVS